jgi:hypothetical protein
MQDIASLLAQDILAVSLEISARPADPQRARRAGD